MNAVTKPTNATAAGASLRVTLAAQHALLRDAVNHYRAASVGLSRDADLLDALRNAGNIVLAAEAITAAAKEAEAIARAALAQAMSETGCASVALASHTVHLGTKPPRVDIEDASAIPTELMRIPAPQPDKAAIARRLRAGRPVPGARLINSNEAMCIFRSRPA